MPRILVADDNSNIQKMVALALEERGIDVVSVGNGEAAVRRIPDLAPDLVLADVFMPVRNGYEVCEFVKTNQRFAHVPVILLVGAFDPLDEKEARRVGADGVLKKPFVPPDPLIAMVTSALEKNPKFAPEEEKRPAPAFPAQPAPVAKAAPNPAPKPLTEFAAPAADDEPPVYGFEKAHDTPSATEFSPRFSSREMQQPQEEFDSATASDWRRDAANFEIPEDLNGKMALSPDDVLGSAVFPSELDAPPKHVPLSEAEREEPGNSASDSKRKPAFFAPTEALSGSTGYGEAAETVAPPESTSPQELQSSQSEESPVPVVPSSSEHHEAGWMSALLDKFRHSEEAPEQTGVQEESSAPEKLPEPVSAQPEPTLAGTPSAPLAGSQEEEAQEDHHPFFAAEPAASESWLAPPVPASNEPQPSTEALSETRPTFSADSASNLMAAPADVNADERGRWSAAFDSSSASEATPAGNTEWENETTSSEPESDTEARSFFVPSTEEAEVDHNSADDSASQYGSDESIFASAPSVQSESPVETPSSAYGETASDERIPTAPPPNREALAEIPFLTPPPPAPFGPATGAPQADQSAEPGQNAAAESPSVDAVVTRLLERIEPQLHEMLAKDLLKPLVENLLQQELANKPK